MPSLSQAQKDKIEDNLSKKGLKYIKQARDFYENRLGKIHNGLSAVADIHPDLYTAFLYLQLQADLSSAFIESEWEVCLYEAVNHYMDADQADQLKEERVFNALGDRYSKVLNELSKLNKEERKKKFRTLVTEKEKIVTALHELQAFRMLYFLEPDNGNGFVLRRSENSSLDEHYIRTVEECLSAMRRTRRPSDTSALRAFATNEMSTIWSRLCTAWTDKRLQKSQTKVIHDIAVWARRLSLILLLESNFFSEFLAASSNDENLRNMLGAVSNTQLEMPSIDGTKKRTEFSNWLDELDYLKDIYYDQDIGIKLPLLWSWRA